MIIFFYVLKLIIFLLKIDFFTNLSTDMNTIVNLKQRGRLDKMTIFVQDVTTKDAKTVYLVADSTDFTLLCHKIDPQISCLVKGKSYLLKSSICYSKDSSMTFVDSTTEVSLPKSFLNNNNILCFPILIIDF